MKTVSGSPADTRDIRENDFVLAFSPTQEKFVYSESQVVMLRGPMGEGKTFAGVGGLIAHAARCGRDIRGALVRDTHQNIKISTIPDIQEMLGSLVTFHDDYKKMVIHSTPKVEMDLFGIDDPASLSKLQGPQYAIIWLEEPAPIIEKANAGLPRGVFEMALARAARQRGTVMRVQITQNPADETHWTEELASGPSVLAEDPETGDRIMFEVFNIPRGENRHANPLSRLANMAAFANDPGKYARYVEGRAAPVCKGKPVIPVYNPSLHYSDRELDVVEGSIGVRGWDSFHHPACVIAQYVPPGRLIIHDVCVGEGIGPRELIELQLLPLLNTQKYKGKIHNWRDIGDPSMLTPDQSSTAVSAAIVVEDLLDTRFEPGPVRWHNRINPTITAFTRLAPDGKPLIELSKSAYTLHRALNGGFHWKTDNNGNIVGSLPVNDEHSHPCQALMYMVAEVFPFEDEIDLKNRKKRMESQKDRMARAMSYSMSRPQSVALGGF